jgi:sec-independent protein translocase protein TatC
MLFALIFQMPVAAAFLGRTGIFDKSFLQRHFRIVVFLTALFAAIVTPPDLLSLFWIAIPMLLLYGISLITYRLSWRAK